MNSSCAKENVFFEANFTPAFYDKDSLGNLTAEAERLCGEDLACLFDIAQTRNLDVGKATKGFEEENNQIKEILGKFSNHETTWFGLLFHTFLFNFKNALCYFQE